VSFCVGILTYALDRGLTGIGRYSYELVRAFSKMKPRIDIVLLAAGALGPLEKFNAFKSVRLPASRLLPGLMTVGQISLLPLGRNLGLDLVHDPTGAAPLLFASCELPVLTTIHDVFPLSIPGYSAALDNLIYRFWLPRVVPKLNAVITISSQSCQDIHRYLSVPCEKINIIPYGVSNSFKPLQATKVCDYLKGKFKIEDNYILYVGALTRRKNIVHLVEAYVRVLETHPGTLLVITGPDSWVKSPVEETIERLGLQGQVLLTGPQTDQDLVYLYNGAVCFAFPSLYEGFGLPPLEAMACGTPVVTSNVASLPEVVGDAALLVDPYDVGSIAAAMQRILEDPALAEDLRAKGLHRASQFTWERTARETIAVYGKVLGKNII
jgi:glycosyltransferase involved in cell wall biosynthesis